MALAWIFAGSDAEWVMAWAWEPWWEWVYYYQLGWYKSVIATDVLQAGIFIGSGTISLRPVEQHVQIPRNDRSPAKPRGRLSFFNWFNGALDQGGVFMVGFLAKIIHFSLSRLLGLGCILRFTAPIRICPAHVSTGSKWAAAVPCRWHRLGVLSLILAALGIPFGLLSAANDAGGGIEPTLRKICPQASTLHYLIHDAPSA